MERGPVLVLLILLSCAASFGQPKKFMQVEDADEHFDHGNYLFAIPVYQQELRKDPSNLRVKFRLGICYLFTRVSREESISYLEECSRHPRAEPEVWLYLGRAYHLNNRIDEAKSAYTKFIELRPKDSDDARRYLRQCGHAEQLMQHPADVTLQNLGEEINSEEPDYNPFINRWETFLVFTSRRKENIGGKKVEVDGYRSSDVYQSEMKDGRWQRAKNAGRSLNTNLDEQVVGLRSDGLEMYLYIDHIDKFGDIYVSTRKDEVSDFPKPRIFEGPVNEKIETSGCVSDDGSPLFFARRNEVDGNSDLYMSQWIPGGRWALPIRLPDHINTPQNEDFPFLTQDGTWLYFASEGHNSMGGYDLFRARYNKENNTFGAPENLGYPINSTDDDRSICVTPDHRLAYISAYRPNGIGDLDIYRVKFNQFGPVVAIYAGQVYYGDTARASRPKSYVLNIIATNKENKDEYTFVPHPRTGRYVMALPAGDYRITARVKGFESYSEEIHVTDLGQLNDVREKNIVLKRLPPAKKPPAKKPPVKKKS